MSQPKFRGTPLGSGHQIKYCIYIYNMAICIHIIWTYWFHLVPGNLVDKRILGWNSTNTWKIHRISQPLCTAGTQVTAAFPRGRMWRLMFELKDIICQFFVTWKHYTILHHMEPRRPWSGELLVSASFKPHFQRSFIDPNFVSAKNIETPNVLDAEKSQSLVSVVCSSWSYLMELKLMNPSA
jgi:hypothetical protein